MTDSSEGGVKSVVRGWKPVTGGSNRSPGVPLAQKFKCEDDRRFDMTMATDISERVQEIARARNLPESEVFEQALERGIEDLWRDVVLSLYFDGELDRQEAVERVGRTTVERAEREREAVEEDVDWGLNA
jgi:predicted transcriptional regulator